MVMGRDSRSKGRGFESQHCILDFHFLHIIVVKIVMIFVGKRPKINEKRPGLAQFFQYFIAITLFVPLPVDVGLADREFDPARGWWRRPENSDPYFGGSPSG